MVRPPIYLCRHVYVRVYARMHGVDVVADNIGLKGSADKALPKIRSPVSFCATCTSRVPRKLLLPLVREKLPYPVAQVRWCLSAVAWWWRRHTVQSHQGECEVGEGKVIARQSERITSSTAFAGTPHECLHRDAHRHRRHDCDHHHKFTAGSAA